MRHGVPRYPPVAKVGVEPLWSRIPPEKLDLQGISWLIAGGESGRKDAVRPFHLDWARELRALCQRKKVAFFLKQLGCRPFESSQELKLRGGHGGNWSEWAEDLRCWCEIRRCHQWLLPGQRFRCDAER